MKRGIFHKRSIDVCLDELLLATPIRPTTLVFDPGEEVVVAVPKSMASGVGEYQFLFRVEGYIGDDPERAQAVFGRAAWRHFYRLASAAAIAPFALDDVIALAGDRGPEIWERYHGQTQHHRIIRTIYLEDAPLFSELIEPATEPVWVASPVVDDNEQSVITARVRDLTTTDIVRRLKTMDKQNRGTPPGKQYRAGKSQKRNAEFTELVRALYAHTCQVCGLQLLDANGVPRGSEVHHLEPWQGDHSDRLDNVICLCPNDHKRFTLKTFAWSSEGLRVFDNGELSLVKLAVDLHLQTKLLAPKTVTVTESQNQMNALRLRHR